MRELVNTAMKRIYLSPPDAGPLERELLLDAFDSNWIAPLGAHVDAFEREFAAVVGVPNALAVSSGTGALHLCLAALGIGKDDEVLTSTLTFVATANAITYVGATPVFIDAARATWTMDRRPAGGRADDPGAAWPSSWGSSLSRSVRAVLRYDRLAAVCQRYGVPLVADAAEALGAHAERGQAGSFGDCAAFSFNGNKIITTGGGGMVVSHNRALVERATASRHAGPGSCATLPALGNRIQLPDQQSAGRDWSRAARDACHRKSSRRRGIRRRVRRSARLLTLASASCPRRRYGRSNAWLTCITVDPLLFGATSETRYAFTSNHTTSKRALSGNRCIFSRCFASAASGAGRWLRNSSPGGCVCRVARDCPTPTRIMSSRPSRVCRGRSSTIKPLGFRKG